MLEGLLSTGLHRLNFYMSSGSLGTATGWGWVARRLMAETLQELELDILSSYDCSQVQRARGPQVSREKMICATGKGKGRMCYGKVSELISGQHNTVGSFFLFRTDNLQHVLSLKLFIFGHYVTFQVIIPDLKFIDKVESTTNDFYKTSVLAHFT